MTILLILSTIACLTALVVTYWLHHQYHLDLVVRPGPRPADAPLISIVVPARNEGRNIRRCVEALLAQDYPRFELIVVDDRSGDETPAILNEIAARDARLRVIRGAELPEGWAGKPHALYQGAAAASGEWLCFIDADTFTQPQAISAVYQAAEAQQADLFTIMTRQEVGSFWEKVILPLVFTALSVGFSPRRVNDPARPDAVANGQFLCLRRSVYQAIGGYTAIRDQIVEDKAMAEAVKRRGYRLIVADGQLVAVTRMYTSLAELWEGWTKNMYLGLVDRLWLLLLGALVGLLGALFLPAWLAVGVLLATGVIDWGPLLPAQSWQAALLTLQAVLVWITLLAYRARVGGAFDVRDAREGHRLPARRGLPTWYALTLPLGALIFTAMMLTSTFKVLSGRGVTWKGRQYHTRRRPESP